jgi:hypothetical protein
MQPTAMRRKCRRQIRRFPKACQKKIQEGSTATSKIENQRRTQTNPNLTNPAPNLAKPHKNSNQHSQVPIKEFM